MKKIIYILPGAFLLRFKKKLESPKVSFDNINA